MQDRLESYGQGKVPVAFAHANGFPPGSYRQFLAELSDRCTIKAYRQRPLWDSKPPPRNLNWSLFAEDLVEFLRHQFDEPVWMMGHSLGGAVAIIAAARHPELFRGLILIDPVIFHSCRTLGTKIIPHSRLQQMPNVKRALGRPHHFESFEVAFDFYRDKRAFTNMSDAALWDYVRASKVPIEEGGVALAYPGRWEAGVYASPAWMWPRIIRLKLPTLGLVARESDVLSRSVVTRWRRLQSSAEIQLCPGGHLLPLERPQETAGRVLDFLDRQGA